MSSLFWIKPLFSGVIFHAAQDEHVSSLEPSEMFTGRPGNWVTRLFFGVFRTFHMLDVSFRYRTQHDSCSARWGASIECWIDAQIESLKNDSQTCDLEKYDVSCNRMYAIFFSVLDNCCIDCNENDDDFRNARTAWPRLLSPGVGMDDKNTLFFTI